MVLKDDTPRYFQLYLYDTNHELANRMSILEDTTLSEKVMGKINKIMDQNSYAQFFTHLEDHTSLENFEICISANVLLDQRVYNKSTMDQVAAIWIDSNNPNMSFQRDIAIHEHSWNTHRVKHYYGCYDILQYPLVLPKGEVGWHQRIMKCRNPNGLITSRSITSASINTLTYATTVEIIATKEQDKYI